MILITILLLLAFYLTYSQIISKKPNPKINKIEHMSNYKQILPITTCTENVAKPKLIKLPIDWFKFFNNEETKFRQRPAN